MKLADVKRYYKSTQGIYLSDSGGRRVVDKMADLSLNRAHAEWSGTDRPEYTDIDGISKVCVEAERTNLAQRSQGFNFAIWQKVSDATVTSDAAIAPDGTQTAALADVSSEGAHIYQDLGALEGDYTFSFFAKAVSGSGTWTIRFNQTGATESENIEINSEKWTRISLTQTFDGSSNVLAYVADSRQGATLNQAYIWGAQVEQGSYPTLYIPTSGSTVTRLAPTVTIEDALPLTGTVAGVVDMVRTVGAYQYIFDSNGDTSTARTQLIIHENGNILARAYGGDGGLISEPFPFGIGDNERFTLRYAMSWDADNLYLFLSCENESFFRSTPHQINDSTYTGVWLGQPRGGGTSYSSFHFLTPLAKTNQVLTTEEEFEQLFEVIS